MWYFLKNCLKGHLRRVGRPLTAGAGVPSTSVSSYENFLKNATLGGKQLGDAESWEELEAGGSIIAGSPKTVRERLWMLIEQAGVGNLLIQFHFGNMRDDLARKSMRLFADRGGAGACGAIPPRSSRATIPISPRRRSPARRE